MNIKSVTGPLSDVLSIEETLKLRGYTNAYIDNEKSLTRRQYILRTFSGSAATFGSDESATIVFAEE